MNSFRKIIGRISDSLGILGTIALVGMTFGLASDVALRTLAGQGIPGMFETVEPLIVIVAFMSLAAAERANEHVSLSLVSDRLPLRLRYILIASGMALTIGLFGWIAYNAILQAFISYTSGEVRAGVVRIPLWPARIAIIVGAVALILQLCVTFADAIASAVRKEHVGEWAERAESSDSS